MNTEEEKLLAMFNANKISASDYQMLIAAINKKSFCTQIENSWLVNPFQVIAGYEALFLGLVLIIVMSLIGTYAEVYFDGILGFITPYNLIAMKPNFLLLIYQNSVAWLVLACTFYVTALLLRQKNQRIIDFLGTVSLARFPILIPLIFTAFQKYWSPNLFKAEDLSKGVELHLNVTNTLGWLVMMGSLAWILMTYLFAFKESSGAEGRKLWIGYITSIVIGNILAMILTRWFLFV
ncbi:MAG: hypothetical protein J0I93_08870 [Legionella sp.]|nr:hypothetical protein [Legionella sp.]